MKRFPETSWDEIDMTTYHLMLDYLCDECGVGGSPTFLDAVASIKERLPARGCRAFESVDIVESPRPKGW